MVVSSPGVSLRVPWLLRACVITLFAFCLIATFSLLVSAKPAPLVMLCLVLCNPLAAAILFWVARLQRGAARRGWLWLAFVPLLIMGMNVIFAWLSTQQRPLFPSVADILYYGVLFCFVKAFYHFTSHARISTNSWQQRFDIAILVLALTVYLWRFVLSKVAAQYIETPYILVFFLLAVVFLLLPMSLALLSAWRDERLEGVHTFTFTVAFLLHVLNVLLFFTRPQQVSLELPPAASLPLWTLFFFAASGVLGLRPMPNPELLERLLVQFQRVMPYAPYAAMLASFALLLDPTFVRVATQNGLSQGQLLERGGVLIGSMLVCVFVMLRQILTMRENQRLNRELQAFSSELEVRVKERTQQLEDSRSRLAANERLASLGRISAGLAHEINTPVASAMNALKQASHLAEEYQASIGNQGVTDDDHLEIAKELRHALLTTDSSLERLGEFVRRMRSQVRHAAGKNDFEAVRVVKDSLSMLEHRARKAKVNLVFSEPAAFYFYGDAARFAQVVSNLVVNALDACEGNWQEKSVVTVALESTPEGLRLEVRDNGAGIPKHMQAKIFEPLFTTKEVGKGTGLGLAIIQDIVYGDFDGRIELESEIGQGTLFRVLLPNKKQTVVEAVRS